MEFDNYQFLNKIKVTRGLRTCLGAHGKIYHITNKELECLIKRACTEEKCEELRAMFFNFVISNKEITKRVTDKILNKLGNCPERRDNLRYKLMFENITEILANKWNIE